MSDTPRDEPAIDEAARALVSLERLTLTGPDKHRQGLSRQAEQLGERLERARGALAVSSLRLRDVGEAEKRLVASHGQLLERRGRQFDALLRNQQVEQIALDDAWLIIRTVPITVTLPASRHYPVPRRYNIGRWFVRIRLQDLIVRVFPAEGQHREHGGTMLHPHIYNKPLGPPEYPQAVEANEVCWGNLKIDALRAMERQEYSLLLEYVLHLLTNIQPDDPAFFAAVTEIGTPLPD